MEFTLKASQRDMDVKAKAVRESGYVPGCVFGKGFENLHIQIPELHLKKCIKNKSKKVNLEVENHGTYLVGLEELQRNHLGSTYMHVSFHVLNNKEKAVLDVPVEFYGKAKGQLDGGIVSELIHHISVKGYPQDIPDAVKVDVSSLEIGQVYHVSDVASQFKFEFLSEDMDKVLVRCAHAKVVDLGETVVEPELAVESDEASDAVAETEVTEEKKVA